MPACQNALGSERFARNGIKAVIYRFLCEAWLFKDGCTRALSSVSEVAFDKMRDLKNGCHHVFSLEIHQPQ